MSALRFGCCGESDNGGLDRELDVFTSDPEESFEDADSVERWYGFPMPKPRACVGAGRGGTSWNRLSLLDSVLASSDSDLSAIVAVDSLRILKDLEGLNELMLPISSSGRIAAATDGLGRCDGGLNGGSSRSSLDAIELDSCRAPSEVFSTGDVCDLPSWPMAGRDWTDCASSRYGARS